MTNLTEIIDNLKNGITREEQDRRDAARYRYLKRRAVLEDLYDLTGHGSSSWDWAVRLETGESKGSTPPENTADFDTVVDRHMSVDGYIDLPRATPNTIPFKSLEPTVLPGNFKAPRFVTDPPYVTVVDMMKKNVPMGTHLGLCSEMSLDDTHEFCFHCKAELSRCTCDGGTGD